MKHIGVREFRDNASHILAGREPVAIERHGHLLGFFIPVRPDPAARDRALARLQDAVGHIMAETNLSEDEVAALLDIRDRSDSEVATES